VNPSFSATRNQGRQKLARYGLKEFRSFIYDILTEVYRRYHDFIQPSPKSRQNQDSTTALINAFINSGIKAQRRENNLI